MSVVDYYVCDGCGHKTTDIYKEWHSFDVSSSTNPSSWRMDLCSRCWAKFTSQSPDLWKAVLKAQEGRS